MFLSIFLNCCIVSSCLIHLYSYTTCLYILICLLPFKSRNSMCEFRKLNTNLLVSCFSYKCSEERRHGLLSIWQWQPVATLLKNFLKNSCQKCFKYFFFFFFLSHIFARYMHFFYFSQYFIKRKGTVWRWGTTVWKNRNLDIMKQEQQKLAVQFSKNKHPFNHKMI